MAFSSDKIKGKKVLFILLQILLLGIFCFSGYRVFSIVAENKRAETSYEQLREQITARPNEIRETVEPEAAEAPVTPETAIQESMPVTETPVVRKNSVDIMGLQEQYPDAAGWIVLSGTEIDHPIMQTDDNSYYLTHLYDGSWNVNGALFVDYRNQKDFSDDNTVIYGHNMKSAAMFHDLNGYKEQSFYDSHPTMVLTTIDGDYLVELISGTIEDGSREFVRLQFPDFAEMDAYLTELRDRSTFQSDVSVQEGDRLISLVTCTYERYDSRFLIVGKITPIFE